MVSAKSTPTHKWEFGIRHLVFLVLYNDVLDFWNLCLFVWLLWDICYWAGLGSWIMIRRSALPSDWSLISLVNPYLGVMVLAVLVSLDRMPSQSVGCATLSVQLPLVVNKQTAFFFFWGNHVNLAKMLFVMLHAETKFTESQSFMLW